MNKNEVIHQAAETAVIVMRVAKDLEALSTRAKEGDQIAHKAIKLAKEGIDRFLSDIGPAHDGNNS